MFRGEINVGTKQFEFVVPDFQRDKRYYNLAAQTVSAWTQGEHMLPKTPLDIIELFIKGRSVLIQENDSLLGHGAITAEYSGKRYEIGSIVVAPDHRHQGVGTAITYALLALAKKEGYADWTAFALANPISAMLFEKMNAQEMSTAELGDEPWVYCVTCPKLSIQIPGSAFICCDKPYNLTPLVDVAQTHVKWTEKQYGEPLPAPYRGHEAGWGLPIE